jgi:hypothetical protein
VTIEAELPDGRVLEFPDGTDRAVIQGTVKKMLGAQAAPSSDLSATLAQIDKMQTARMGGEERYDPEGSTTNYLAQQFKKGVAATAGLPVDAITNALNLGIAGYGTVKGALGSTDLPELIRDPVGGSGTFERMFLTNNQIKPTSRAAEVGGRFVRDLGSAALPAGAIASKAANPLASLGLQSGLSVLASGGGETARTLAPEPYKDVADMAGMLGAGVVLPGMVANRLEAVNSLRNATTPNRINAFADDYVRGQIEGNVRNYPGAAQNLDDALRMEDEIPGLKLRIGQASGVPSTLDMERRVAVAGPEQFNRRAIQDAAQRAAIRTEAERRLPLLAGKNDVSQQLATTQAQRRALAEMLPETAADDVGQILRQSRQSLKGRYDQIAAEKFNAPVVAAEKLGVKVNVDPLIEKTTEMLQSPILQYDATNAPAIARRMQSVLNKELPDNQSPILGPEGQPIHQLRDRSFGVPFSELKAMREAVNQDIAREAGSATPNARQRLRGLLEIRQEIDRAAQQTPDEVKKPYNDAVRWYREVYSPRFLRGVNLRQSMKDITGEMKIPDEKLASQYFKPMGVTPMNRFLDLYGDNPQAMKGMESHILDTYRRYTVKDGVIDPLKHEAFMKNYGPSLKKLPETEQNFRSIAKASALLAERETQLSQAQKLLSQGQLDALKYEALPDAGLDPRKVNAFLSKNGESFADSVGAIYGEKTAADHLKNLREIAKAAEMADRGRLAEAATPKQSTSPMSLQSGFGFTGRTVFSMIRAVTTGRTSGEDVAYTLGMQSASHRVGKALIAAEERAISDPETAKLIADAVKQPLTSQQGQLTLRKLLTKGGMFLVGGDKWADMAKYRAAPFAAQATQEGLAPGEQEQQGNSLRRSVSGTMVPNTSIRRPTPYDGGVRG